MREENGGAGSHRATYREPTVPRIAKPTEALRQMSLGRGLGRRNDPGREQALRYKASPHIGWRERGKHPYPPFARTPLNHSTVITYVIMYPEQQERSILTELNGRRRDFQSLAPSSRRSCGNLEHLRQKARPIRENSKPPASIHSGPRTVVRYECFNRNGAARAPVARSGGDPPKVGEPQERLGRKPRPPASSRTR
jgi:hypothetical protein